jgi:lipoate-protein ligase A
MAYQMDIPLMLKVLRIGPEKLSDKGTRSADKRVGALRQQTELPRDEIIGRLLDEFRARYPSRADALTPDEIEAAERRARERFATRAWTHILP